VLTEARALAKADSEGQFLEAIKLLEWLIGDLGARNRRECLAEPLMARSQLLDEALNGDRHLEEYAAFKSLPPPKLVVLGLPPSARRSSVDKQAISLHAAAGYLNAIAVYKKAADKPGQMAAEKALETALARARAYQTCRDARMQEREFRKRFAQLGERLIQGGSTLDTEEQAAVTAWNMASQVEQRATRNRGSRR
jgi:hypothetical protein